MDGHDELSHDHGQIQQHPPSLLVSPLHELNLTQVLSYLHILHPPFWPWASVLSAISPQKASLSLLQIVLKSLLPLSASPDLPDQVEHPVVNLHSSTNFSTDIVQAGATLILYDPLINSYSSANRAASHCIPHASWKAVHREGEDWIYTQWMKKWMTKQVNK